MKHAAIAATMCLFVAACATPEAVERHRQTCSSYGYKDGSSEMANCVEEKSRQGEAAASRVGTSLLTSALLGAL